MRKDVRLGAAIGGILIAVLVVYGIVVSKNHPKKSEVVIDPGKTAVDPGTDGGASPDHPDVTPGTAQPADGAPAPDSATPTGPATPAPAAGHVDPPATPTPTPPTPAHKPMTDWSALLQADHVVLTNTPTDGLASGEVLGASDHHIRMTSRAPSEPRGTARLASDTQHPDTAVPATYTIQNGDTLSSIARKMYGDSRYYKQIAKANPKLDPNHLHLGTKITLPDRATVSHASASAPASGSSKPASDSGRSVAAAPKPVNSATEYRVQSNDSLYKISMKLYHTPNKVDAIYQLNKSTIGVDPAKLKLNMVLKLPEPPTRSSGPT